MLTIHKIATGEKIVCQAPEGQYRLILWDTEYETINLGDFDDPEAARRAGGTHVVSRFLMDLKRREPTAHYTIYNDRGEPV